MVFEDSAAGIAAGRAAGTRIVGVGSRAAALEPTAHAGTLERITVLSQPSGSLSLRIG